MQEVLDFFMLFLKKYSPYILGGLVGSVIHRMRTEMNLITFLKSVVMSIFVSIVVGIFLKDYLKVTNENVIFALCGVSGVFSKIILDELEQIVKLSFIYLKNKIKKQE